ncbi:cysteine-rich receptor-like protein kinase 10 [Macadamia integrifolia]|uniref:cysteine-rich receptor-like protein kinase 10 n=1 Tax=Macadamia integrifolia TaxID=60698 RepID=UPI001C501866|nr:cysteine-rich receptor-like protein kinase 10 [Macadamia integrifolia]
MTFLLGNDSLEFDLSTIKAATKNFDTTNTLGQGGFGIVYQGILPNGQEIAVKRLSKNSGQGDKEFRNEVQLVANLQHKNLVRLLGFCMREDEKLLIYEFVPNASLDRFLFDPIKRSNLNWEARYKIIAGIARGLVYLHEDSRLKIIHRDLKSSNILLDSDLCPKIADFGMARLVGMDETHLETSRIAGTYGYMAPEYVLNGQFSVKSDVYSYGVLILEIVSGQRNGSNSHQLGYSQDLLRHAWEHWAAGTPMEFVDFTVRERCSKNEALRSIHIGLSCIQDEPALRPSMASVVLTLQTDSLTLPVPSPPAFLANGMGMHTREYFQRRILSTTTASI